MAVDDLRQGPREYPTAHHLFLGVMVIVNGFFIWFLSTSNILLGLTILAGVLFLCWHIFQEGHKLFLVLGPEELRFPNDSPPFTLRRADIIGQQRVYLGGSRRRHSIVLCYRKSESEIDHITIPLVYDEDRYFGLWFGSLPNTNVLENAAIAKQAAIVEAIKQNPTLGQMPEERVAKHATIKNTVLGLGIALLALPLFMILPIPGLIWFSVMPYLLTLALLGVAGFIWHHRAIFSSDPNLRVGFYVPTVVVAGLQCFMSVWQADFLHLDRFVVLMGAVVVGAILELVTGAAHGKKELMFALPIVMFALGSAILVNKDLDRRATTIQAVAVLKGDPLFGGSAKRIVLSVSGDSGLSKEKMLFSPAKVGDKVCIKIHPGALGLAWFTLHLPPGC